MRYASLVAMIGATLALSAPAHAAGTALELQGDGWQIYTCEAKGAEFAWRLKAPEARLLDSSGAEFGHHFSGPSWQAQDGSTVVGEVLVANPAPQPGSIPWLLLRAKSHAGSGVLDSAAFIARVHTEGGLPPAAGCDGSHAGSESRVPYRALYIFFFQP